MGRRTAMSRLYPFVTCRRMAAICAERSLRSARRWRKTRWRAVRPTTARAGAQRARHTGAPEGRRHRAAASDRQVGQLGYGGLGAARAPTRCWLKFPSGRSWGCGISGRVAEASFSPNACLPVRAQTASEGVTAFETPPPAALNVAHTAKPKHEGIAGERCKRTALVSLCGMAHAGDGPRR